jgi:N-acyl-D-aspartate/D-glutamate deacylase
MFPAAPAAKMRTMSADRRPLTLLITGGTVVDGTGAPRYEAAVGVLPPDDGGTSRIVVLRDPAQIDAARGTARRSIAAAGKVIAPGFIDVHSHSGLLILADPGHDPKVRQGVTTEIVGVDGLSYAPFTSAEDLADFTEMNAGLDGDPRPAIKLEWGSVESYLSRFDADGVNIGMPRQLGPLATVGWLDRPADAAAVTDMRAMLRAAMEEGAFGISSGLDYPPGAYATTDELAALANEAAHLGGFYHTHVRYTLGDRFLDPYREAIEIGRRGIVDPTPTSTTAILDARQSSRSWTTPAPRASTSRSTRIPTNGRAHDSSSPSRSGSRRAGPGRPRSAWPIVRFATGSGTSSRSVASCTPGLAASPRSAWERSRARATSDGRGSRSARSPR